MYIPKNKLLDYQAYQREKDNYRRFVPHDSHRLRVKVLVLVTKGNGEWETYDRYYLDEADVGKVSEQMAEVYLLNMRKSIKFKRQRERVLIKR